MKNMTLEQQVSVLLVEDEESFVDALVVGLSKEGYKVTVARDGSEALTLFESAKPDLVLLDVMLPRVSGIDVCKKIRKYSDVPIIMVTAKSEEIDTIIGLEVGADDYVTKPFKLRELLARIRALLRRSSNRTDTYNNAVGSLGNAPVYDSTAGILEVNNVKLDPLQHQVTVSGRKVQLPLKEFELLEILMSNSGRVLTREILIDRVWGSDYVGDTKTLDVHIKRLRSKVEKNASKPVLITTIRGVGYRFEKTGSPGQIKTH